MARRLTADESQQVFRGLLDALANPGRPEALRVSPAAGDPVELPLLALADLDVVMFLAGAPGPVGADLVRATGTRLVDDPARADLAAAFSGVAGTELVALIGALRRGDAMQPEQGARLFLACEQVASAALHARPAHPESIRLWVSGPGATPGRLVDVLGVAVEAFEALQAANRDFPAGIDTWLVAADATVVGLPRSCRIELVAQVVR